MKENSRNTKIFISYSRKDKLFTRKLNNSIKSAGIDVWVDWESIPLSSDWMKEITTAIEGSDAFIFVISPDSLSSQYCMQELELSIKYNKKILPVLLREPEKKHKMHPILASTNWVYLRSKKDDFKTTIPKLVEAIQTDLGWVQQHTRLLQRATEWNLKDRNNSYLLQGIDLEDGEHWMTQSTVEQGRRVMPVQAEYINTSRKLAVKRQRNLTIGVGAALVVSVLLAIYAFNQSIEARKSRDQAESSQKIAEASERARATQQVIAEDNARMANAQRSAAEANIYQNKVGELGTSTLLAVDAYQQLPELADAENILRHNISLLPIPINQMDVKARIWDIMMSPDQKKFVSVDFDGKACLWKTDDGTKIFCLQHEGIVYDAVFSKDGTVLVTGTEKGALTFWDLNTGTKIKSLQFEGTIWDLDLQPNGNRLAVGRSKAVSLIDMKNMNEELYFTQSSEVKAVAFDPTGRYLAMGTSNGYVSIWIVNDHSFAGARHNNEVYDLAFSPDNNWLVSVGADSTARASRIPDGGQKYLITHGDWVENVAFGPNASWYATASDDNFVRVIDTVTGQERMRMAHADYVKKVTVSAGGQWIASTGGDRTARIWDAASGAEMMRIPINGAGSTVQFNSDTTRLVVGDRNGQITLWDISQLKARTNFIEFPQLLHEAHYSPNGNWLVVNSDDKNVWMIKSDQLNSSSASRQKFIIANGFTYNLAVSADSNWVAATEYDINTIENNRVVVANSDGTGKFFLENEGEVVQATVFMPDNKAIVVAYEDGSIIVWDLKTRQKDLVLRAKDKIIHSIDISPEGKYLVAGLEKTDYSLIWDMATQTQVMSLPQSGNIIAAKFSNDGKILATGSSDSTVYLWDVADGRFNQMKSVFHVNGEVSSMGFNPENGLLAVGDSTGYAYLFDITQGQEVARLHHIDKVTSVSFSPDGKQLATVARKTISFWDVAAIPHVKRDELTKTACARLINNIDENKWKLLFFEEKYRLICPNLPAGQN
jgi:WD40 repeat protein